LYANIYKQIKRNTLGIEFQITDDLIDEGLTAFIIILVGSLRDLITRKENELIKS
jgi:hypothetical protein